MTINGFAGIYRAAAMILGLLYLLPSTASAACWNIVTPGETVSATDLWQIRNHTTGSSTLQGTSGNESLGISVDRVQSFSVTGKAGSGWLSGNRHAATLHIQLIDGRTVTLVSEMGLYYIPGNEKKRQTLPLKDIVSVNRCTDESSLPDESSMAPAAVQAAGPKPSAPVLIMKNGDILYGEVAANQLLWQTSYASVGFKPGEIKAIKSGCGDASAGVLETLAGDRLNGSFGDTSVSFHLTTGQVIDIPTDQVELIDFTGAPPGERCRKQ